MKPKSALTLATFLPYRLNVLAAVSSEGLAQLYSDRFGIGVPEWRVLATVAEFNSITAKAVGDHAHMSKVKVSRAVAALEERRLVERRPSSDDRREAYLALTTAGEAIYAEIAPIAIEYAARLESALTPDERAVLETIIDKLVTRAREL